MAHWRAYKSLEWFIFIGFSVVTFVALVAAVMLIVASRQARMIVWQQPQVAATPAASPVSTEGLSSDLSSKALASEEALAKEGWQTYRNERYGYEIQIPESWGAIHEYYGSFLESIPTDTPLLILAAKGGASTFQIAAFDPASPDYVGQDFSRANVNGYLQGLKDRSVAYAINSLTTEKGMSVTKVTNEFGSTYLITNGNKFYTINPGAYQEVDRILDSFQFLVPDTTDWQTYRDGKLGIELEYPADWKADKESTVGYESVVYSRLIYNPNADSNENPDPYMSDQGDAGVTIFLFPNITQGLDTWYAKLGYSEERIAEIIRFMNSEAGEGYVSRKDINFQGSIAAKVGGLPAIAEYLQFEVTTPTGDRTDDAVALFDRIIASIRFTR